MPRETPSFLSATLDVHNLVDIPSTKIQATWRNNRIRENELATQLEWFLVKEHVHHLGLNIRQWVGSGGHSEHLPIYMEMEGCRARPEGPFKFYSTWLKEASFINLVTEF